MSSTTARRAVRKDVVIPSPSGSATAESLDASTVPTRCAVPLTPLVGRVREVEEIVQLLETNRLLTLTGAGGSGKTRLAAEVAGLLARTLPHGVVWVELAALSNPALVPQQVAAALGLRENPARAPVSALLEVLREQSPLLVLDNCEHLVEACAGLAEVLLHGCPGLRILATSREALEIGGERAWLVPPLSLPGPSQSLSAEAAAGSEAVQLFVERARAANPRFELTDGNATAVTRICTRLDGIPLAIELAAARVRVLAPEQIALRLDDAFRLLTGGARTALPRQRTLRSTIDWSHDLLADAERTLLRRLSVFVGGFSLEAAEEVCSTTGFGSEQVLPALFGLIDKSLVLSEIRGEQARYRLLETVRQYGQEKLLEAGEPEPFRRRHAEFYLRLAEAAEPHIFGGAADTAWMARLREESHNLRAAADWAAEHDERTEVALRLGAALHWFWFARGHFTEGRRRLCEALDTGCPVAPRVRLRALTALGSVMIWQADRAAMRAPVEAAVALADELGEPCRLVYPLALLAAVETLAGNSRDALGAAERAIAVGDSCEPPVLHALVLYWHAVAAQRLGDLALALSSSEEVIACSRRLGHRPGVAHGLSLLGRVEYLRSNHSEALRALSESLAIHRETGDCWGALQVLIVLARIAQAQGYPRRAARLLGAAARLRVKMGVETSHFEGDELDAVGGAGLDHPPVTGLAAAWAEGEAMTFDEVVAYALEGDAPEGVARPEAPPPPAAPPVACVAPESAPPAQLRVLALGPLQIFRGGELLDDALWSWNKPREVLVLLLCHPDGCTREQIGLACWPDASAEQLKNSFHVTLHRIRKVLGNRDWIVHEEGRYRVLPSLALEFDAVRFERGATEALRAVRRGGGSVEPLAGALALYRGDFLEDEVVGDWHLEHRDRLRRLYVDALMAQGELLVRAGSLGEAAETYSRVLAREDLLEAAHRGLMSCWARTGERVRALRHYQNLVNLLRAELEVDPEPETTALYERIRTGEIS